MKRAARGCVRAAAGGEHRAQSIYPEIREHREESLSDGITAREREGQRETEREEKGSRRDARIHAE